MSDTFEPDATDGDATEGDAAEVDAGEMAAERLASSRQVFDQRRPDLWTRAMLERLTEPYTSTLKTFDPTASTRAMLERLTEPYTSTLKTFDPTASTRALLERLTEPYTSTLKTFDPTASTRAMLERLTEPYTSTFDVDALLRSTQKRFAELQRAIERRRRQLLPANLHDLDGVTITNLSRIADEGITLWHVPSPRTAQRLLTAPTYAARREILGRHGNGILRECRMAAANTVGGPYAAPARELEIAIATAQAGYVRPAISHIANVLDTLLRVAFESTDRADLVRHKATKKQFVMDHFDDLDLRAAMVLRPIWFAYRPMYTAEERARSTSFARHAVAHGMTGPRVLSFRNLVQAAMLAAALINYLTWWDEAR